MDTNAINLAIRDIEKCQTALEWLEKYGQGLDGRNAESFDLTVHLNHASACVGSKEAAHMLARYAALDIEKIVASAISNCRNTIEIREQQIRDELDNKK